MSDGGYLHIVISSVTVYCFIVLAIRVFGKREISQLSIIDLVFILLISNAVQNAMVGPDTSLTGGLLAATALFITNFILKLLFNRFPNLGRWVQGQPVLLIYKGKVNRRNLRKTGISLDELKETVREHGVAAFSEVDLAVLEVDGNISVLSNEFQHRTVRKRKLRRISENLTQS